LAVLALLAGCGGDDGGTAAPPQRATELEITVWPSGRSGDEKKARLTCSPPGGTLDDPDDACRRLGSMERPFVRPNGQVACTEIYGGPAVAEIRGTFDGSQVLATFARSDGCEIAHWDRHQFLFPAQPASP
jgi:Subtilisin inhibitor-like